MGYIFSSTFEIKVNKIENLNEKRVRSVQYDIGIKNLLLRKDNDVFTSYQFFSLNSPNNPKYNISQSLKNECQKIKKLYFLWIFKVVFFWIDLVKIYIVLSED